MFSPRQSPVSLVTVVALLATLGSGCAGDSGSESHPAEGAPGGAPDVVAVFEGGVVHRSEFDRYEERQAGSDDVQIRERQTTDWRESRITEIVVRKILGAEAPPDDPGVRAAIHQGTTGLLIAGMAEELGWDRISATPEELREYYDAHRERYADPKIVRAEHIYLRAEDAVLSEAERKAVRAKLEGIRQEILSGADFTQMVRLHSESDDADRGGVMTLKADANVFPAFADAVWALEVGEVSEVIEIPTGFQLVKTREIIPAVQRDFDAVIDFVRRALLEEKAKAMHEEFVQEAGQRYGLEKHYDRLSNPHISPDEALIIIDEQSYRFQDLAAEVSPTLRSHLYGAFFPQVYEFLDEVTLNILLLKEAERLEMAQRDDIASRIEALGDDFRYRRGLDSRLQAKGAEVAEEDLKEFFVQNEQRFTTISRQDLDVILIKHEPGEPFWATLRRGEELVERLRGGEDFAELAGAHSAHYSASNGGRIENLTDVGIGELVHGRPAFRAALKNLSIGEISEPMVAECYDERTMSYTRTGVLIARVVRLHPGVQKPFEDVRELVRSNYLRRNHQQFEAEIRREVLAAADIEIHFDALPPI